LGSGKASASQEKEHQSYRFIQLLPRRQLDTYLRAMVEEKNGDPGVESGAQSNREEVEVWPTHKQSRWKTRTGHLRSFIPCKNSETVFWSYEVVKEVER